MSFRSVCYCYFVDGCGRSLFCTCSRPAPNKNAMSGVDRLLMEGEVCRLGRSQGMACVVCVCACACGEIAGWAADVEIYQARRSSNSRDKSAYPSTRPMHIHTLFLRNQLSPASLALCPPSTTTPNPVALPPPGLRRRAFVSGEQALLLPLLLFSANKASLGSGNICPVARSTRLSFIHFQFSWSSSGHSCLLYTSPSPRD